MKKLKILILLTFAFLFFYVGKEFVLLAETCGDITDLQKRIDCYGSELTRLGSQSKTLSNQIAQFNAQIKLTTLKIAQTEEKISLLGGRIDQLEGSLDTLTTAFSSRAVETYKMARLGDPLMIVVSAPDLTEAVSRFFYLKRIQESDRDLMQRLEMAQTTYENQKTEEEILRKELEKEKAILNSQKAAKANLLEATKSDEKKYQQLRSDAIAQLAAMRRYVTGQGGATILQNQTKCDSWGCYYNQRDSEWGNIGLGGSSYSVAGYGCLVTSVSMIASHYSKSVKPIDIAVIQSAFVPETGYLYHTFSVNGVGVTISRASKDMLDSELSAGRPVIAGLYGGPDHFIVILKKEGDSYIMHDPFLENGNNRKLNEKYNASDITSLRLVSFN